MPTPRPPGPEPRGGQRVLVDGARAAVVVRCERSRDKRSGPAKRIYLVRYENGAEERVTRSRIEVLTGR